MPYIWQPLSMLGDSRSLLPAAMVLIAFGACQRSRWSLRCIASLCVIGTLVLGSKLAFLGWGIGLARLDFTGFSGHATLSALIWPVLLAVGLSTRRSHWSAAAGLMLAAVIAYSRLPLQAHSWSEIVSGWLLGASGAVWTLRRLDASSPARPGWLATALVAGAFIPLAFPEATTHEAVVRLATALSGAEDPHARSTLHEKSVTVEAKVLTD
ncbi:phosphatase PAP2 family protein [Stenotrophomonas sp. SORGH_AS_0321]|uniref:phosphatase PAP2 family protein n=1 Tax=Stenotrophomonas sp. SORGH_AS_0321 TaxID=3041787 RepID=UPI0028550211|nr:phosphatase PAP2 family protein [Stenotrophomonas sp. SORGH_AS_0321]MDR6094770.1 membrane-associated phospholipid phosphatase [Stenotrophomonas sp. SORGH_AS_0321]